MKIESHSTNPAGQVDRVAWAHAGASRPHRSGGAKLAGHAREVWRGWGAAMAVLLLTGCATYRPHPLTRGAVRRALAVPDAKTLRIEAHKLHNPLLQPVKLNWKQGLTPDRAAVLAVLLNPSLRAQRDQRGLARAQLLAAKVLPNPQLSYSMDVPFGANSAGNVSGYGLGLDYNITALITRGARIGAVHKAAAQVDLDVAWREWQAAEAAKTAVLDLVALQGELAIWKGVQQRRESHLTLVRRAVRRHQSTILKLAAARTARQSAHASYLSTLSGVRQQRLALKRALGLPPQTPINLAPHLTLPGRLSLPTSKQLLSDLARHRLDLLALRRGYQSQEQAVRAAILGQFPKLTLGVSNTRDFGNFLTLGPSVGLELPLFDRNQGAIATQRATRRRLFDQYTNRVYQARADIAQAIERIHSLTGQIDAAHAALPGLGQLVDTYQRAVQQGNADVLSYYQARNDLAHKRIDVLTLKQRLADQWIALELAAGEYLPAAKVEDASASERSPDSPRAKNAPHTVRTRHAR